MVEVLKHLHVSMVGLTILGFLLRGFWAWRYPAMLRRKSVRIVPHVIDTVLLASAIGLLVLYGWNPFAFTWLTAKIVLLVVYIGLGMVALKPRAPAPVRVAAFFGGVGVVAWIVSIAVAHAFVPFA